MAREKHKLKAKHQVSFHSVNDDIPIDKGTITDVANTDHVHVWQLYESPAGAFEASEIFAGDFTAKTFPGSFKPQRPGHYQIFLAHFDKTERIMQVYGQGPHGVTP